MASTSPRPGHPPPPGQGYYPPYPATENSYTNPHHGQEPYFDPPPREPFDPAEDGRYDSRDTLPRPQPQQYEQYTTRRTDSPNEPEWAERSQQVTPYDSEKAEAEWRRGVEDAYARQPPPGPPPPPPADYDPRWGNRARPRDVRRERDFEDDDERYYQPRERRKRRDEEAMKEKALRYPSDPKRGGRDIFGASEGEPGAAAKLAGAAGGAWLGHEAYHDALGVLGGMVLGAMAAGAIERYHEKGKHKRELEGRGGDFPYPPGGRDMEDVRRTGRDGDAWDARARPRRRTRSQSTGTSGYGFRDRLMRSLSRVRSKSRGARRGRSESYDERY